MDFNLLGNSPVFCFWRDCSLCWVMFSPFFLCCFCCFVYFKKLPILPVFADWFSISLVFQFSFLGCTFCGLMHVIPQLERFAFSLPRVKRVELPLVSGLWYCRFSGAVSSCGAPSWSLPPQASKLVQVAQKPCPREHPKKVECWLTYSLSLPRAKAWAGPAHLQHCRSFLCVASHWDGLFSWPPGIGSMLGPCLHSQLGKAAPWTASIRHTGHSISPQGRNHELSLHPTAVPAQERGWHRR